VLGFGSSRARLLSLGQTMSASSSATHCLMKAIIHNILYDGLFSLIDDLLEPPEDPGTIHVVDETTFLFMQDNARVIKRQKS
jgi:hypothetical protein